MSRRVATLFLIGCLLAGLAAASATARDRDGDGMPDRWEKRHGLNPERANGKADPDCDGLTNRREFRNRLHPKDRDVDDDGTSDGEEKKVFSTDPKVADSDGNGTLDGHEDLDEDGIADEDESDPTLCRWSYLDGDLDGIEDEDDDDIAAPGLLARALAGPTCPVQRQGDWSCNDRPVEDDELVVSKDGMEVARLQTAHDGMVMLQLEPGTYQVTPQPVEGLLGTPEAMEIVVTEEMPAKAAFFYDTGIR